MVDQILVFGGVGTEVIVGVQHYEIVVLGASNLATWRTRCDTCRAPFFVQTRDGQLPIGTRCPTHIVSYEARAAAPPKRASGIVSVRDFIPLPPDVARETSAQPNGYDPDLLPAAEDDFEGVSEDPIASSGDPFSFSALTSELSGLAPDGADEEEAVVPRRTSTDMWRRRVQVFVESRMWDPDGWGPRPDQAGCRAPEEVMRMFIR